MKSNARFNLVSVAVVAVVSLAACGGGGAAASAVAATVPVIADVVSSAGTLQTSIPATTYAAASYSASAFNALNVVRQGAGAGLIAQSSSIDVAAVAHAAYFTAHLSEAIAAGTAHFEDITKPDYYEYSVNSRIAKSGYGINTSTEVIGGALIGSDAIIGLLSFVYHSVALLGPYQNIGIGTGVDGASNPLIVGDMASVTASPYSQVPASGSLITYPYAGQVGTPAIFAVNDEVPRIPIALFPNATAGTPILVSVRNADYVNYQVAGSLVPTVISFTLKDAAGNLIPSKILSSPNIQAAISVILNADTHLSEAFVVLVPISPLSQSQTYTASFTAMLKTGGALITKTWSFTTSASR